MISGIGVDLVKVARIERSLQRFGDRFAERILSEAEMAEYRRAPFKGRFLAKRFAAKEAAAKALGTGFRDGLGLRDIVVSHDPLGKPELICVHRARGPAAAHPREGPRLQLSISDEQDYAIAFVIAERNP